MRRTITVLTSFSSLRFAVATAALPGHVLPGHSLPLVQAAEVVGGATTQALEEELPLAPPPKEGVDWDSFGFSLNGKENNSNKHIVSHWVFV